MSGSREMLKFLSVKKNAVPGGRKIHKFKTTSQINTNTKTSMDFFYIIFFINLNNYKKPQKNYGQKLS